MKIVLIGFMGSGKTTVAKLMSSKLNLKTIEMDDLVVKKSGRRSVSEIFFQNGETRFRELEIEVAKEIRNKDEVIVSTGGGAVMNKIIIDYLKEKGKIIFLKTSFKTIKKRLKNSHDRPLFKDRNKARELFDFRQKLYEEYADFIIKTDNKTLEEVFKNIRTVLTKDSS